MSKSQTKEYSIKVPSDIRNDAANKGPANDSKDGLGSGHKKGFANHAIDANMPSRGTSIQGTGQSSKGGPAGANQGGASRGGSRIEPSHQQRAAKKDRGSK